MDYFSYSLPAGFGMRMILETDAAGATVRNRLPEDVLSCENFSVTESLAARINDGVDHLFLLTAMPDGGYQEQPVLMAAVLDEMNGKVRYRSPFSAFSFDRENSVIGVNLDVSQEGAQVTFEGQEGSGCERSYLFQQRKEGTAYPYINYRLIPELGIVERHLTGDGRFSEGESIIALDVNGQPLLTFLKENCAKAEPATSFVPLYIDPQPIAAATPGPAQITSPETKTVQTDVAPAAPPAPSTIHVVAPGETLYAISRRYGVSVRDIQSNNRLNGNVIRVGQELRIGDSIETPAPATANYSPPPPSTPPPTVPNTGNPPIKIPPARTEPAVTDERVADPVIATEVVVPPSASPPYSPSQPATENAAAYHVVRPGETLASIARRYGYTTERFKAFNRLGDAQVALVGQRLKTSHCDCPSSGSEEQAVNVNSPSPADTYSSSYPSASPVIAPSRARPVEVYPAADQDANGAGTPPAYGAPIQQDRAIHTVKDGESLYGIARQYRMSVEALRELNDLLPADVIVPFQKLYVN